MRDEAPVQHGRLYICGTPIGNLEDITLRALRVLRQADLILAEDTRRTRKLLSHYEISTPLLSYNEHNKHKRSDELLQRMRQGQQLVLVSDAGMPAVSDPGADLVRLAADASIQVIPVPGPSAVVTALAVSGFGGGGFCFVGFLPRQKKQVLELMQRVCAASVPTVAYESPHRLCQSLRIMRDTIGERQLCIAREMSKVHEEIFRGTAEEALRRFSEQPVLGEITLVIAGGESGSVTAEKMSDEEALEELARLLKNGMPTRTAAQVLASKSGMSRNELYKAALVLTERGVSRQ
jgi:16S rRNA (cytidine1402-2'-O)-methyltransferase